VWSALKGEDEAKENCCFILFKVFMVKDCLLSIPCFQHLALSFSISHRRFSVCQVWEFVDISQRHRFFLLDTALQPLLPQQAGQRETFSFVAFTLH
jgi:hypothetical protein